MAAKAFGGQPPSCFTASQLQALASKGIEVSDIVDTSCTSAYLNTCERDANELFQTYRSYDPTNGIFRKWGNIDIAWGYENSLSDEKWGVAKYIDQYAYRVGDEIVRSENDGYRTVVYRALVNIAPPAGAFNPAQWEVVCSVSTTEPVGLPTIDQVLADYGYYEPRPFLTRWKEFDSAWGSDLTDPDSDMWSDAKIEKPYVYEVGSVVLYDSGCGDYTCVYVATDDVPPQSINSPPPRQYWEKLYCVVNGKPNKCLSESAPCNRPGRVKVSLSSGNNDLICAPVESRLGAGPSA